MNSTPSNNQDTFRMLLVYFIATLLLFVFLYQLFSFAMHRSFTHFSPVQETSNISPAGMLSGSKEIRILSWNIFMRPPLISNHCGDYKNERLSDFISSYLDKYDVVVLQEMFLFASWRRSHLIQEAKRRGFRYHAAATNAFIDGGLLILSRFLIMQSAYQSFPRGIHSDMLASKGILHANLCVNDNLTMDIFTTHLQASYSHPSSQTELDIRIRQLDIMRNFIDKQTKNSSASIIVLCGDFNIDSSTNEADYNYMKSLFDKDFEFLNKTPTFGVGCSNSKGEYCWGIEDFKPELIFTKNHDWNTCQQIDYMLVKNLLKGTKLNCKVNQMLASKKENRFTHLSGKNFDKILIFRSFCY